MKRQIIEIDDNLCTGCGECIPGCPEGAIQLIDGKARLVSDLFCDGLGACLGNCPFNAISTIVREAEPYSEKITMKSIAQKGTNTIIAHLRHLLNHGELGLYRQAIEFLEENGIPIPSGFHKGPVAPDIPDHLRVDPESLHFGACPEGTCPSTVEEGEKPSIPTVNPPIPTQASAIPNSTGRSELQNWPIKLNLTPVQSRFFHDSALLIAADCVAASLPHFQQTLVKGRTLLMGCPKFDDTQRYIEKLADIFRLNSIKSIHVAIMEIPCCSGFLTIVERALFLSGKQESIPLQMSKISSDGKSDPLLEQT